VRRHVARTEVCIQDVACPIAGNEIAPEQATRSSSRW
jgi:hypothetical protein